MLVFISPRAGDCIQDICVSLSPWERWFLLRWIFQVILQYFVVKLEFTFQLYLICNEGWIIDERDSQLTKKWATTHCTLHYHRRYRVTAKHITRYTTQYHSSFFIQQQAATIHSIQFIHLHLFWCFSNSLCGFGGGERSFIALSLFIIWFIFYCADTVLLYCSIIFLFCFSFTTPQYNIVLFCTRAGWR